MGEYFQNKKLFDQKTKVYSNSLELTEIIDDTLQKHCSTIDELDIASSQIESDTLVCNDLTNESYTDNKDGSLDDSSLKEGNYITVQSKDDYLKSENDKFQIGGNHNRTNRLQLWEEEKKIFRDNFSWLDQKNNSDSSSTSFTQNHSEELPAFEENNFAEIDLSEKNNKLD